MKIVIPTVAPSLNVIMRQNPFEYQKMRRELCQEIWLALIQTGHAKAPPISKARVHIIRRSPKKLDHDNFVGGCKPLLDCLRKVSRSNPSGLGLIDDDNPDALTVTYQQEPSTIRETVLMIEAA